MTEASTHFRSGRSTYQQQRIAQHSLNARPQAQPRPFHTIGVIGAGSLGAAVTASLLDAGFPVTLKEGSAELLDTGLTRLTNYLREQVQAGLMTREDMDSRLDLLCPTCWYVAMSSVDIVLDCTEQDLPEKAAAMAALDRVMKPHAVLAANVSSPDIERLAQITRRRSDVVGVRFAHPAQEIRLMEIAKSQHTAEDAVATIVSLASTMNQIPVVGCVS